MCFKFKKYLKLLIFLLLLSNCGGGGGSVAVQNFVDNVVSELDGSYVLVNSYYSNISSLNSVLSNIDSIQSVFTNPNSKDIENAKALKQIVINAEILWAQSMTLIDLQSVKKKYEIYNSNDYKEAYASYIYLVNYLKPLVEKVALGQNITLTEFKKITDQNSIANIITFEKQTTVNTLIANQSNNLKNIIDSTFLMTPDVQTSVSESSEYTELNVIVVNGNLNTVVTYGTPILTNSFQDTYSDIDNNNGTITRTTKRITTTTTTTPKTTVTSVIRYITDKVYKNLVTTTITTSKTKTIYGDGREVITLGTPVTTTGSPIKTFVKDITRTETVETNRVVGNIISSSNDSPGEVVSVVTNNKIISSTDTLTPVIVTSSSEGAEYIVTTYVDGSENTSITNGTPVVTNNDSNNVIDITNGDGSITRNIYNITTTTTVTPKTTTVIKVRTYADITKKDVTTTTTTTPNTRTNYSDGTYIDRLGISTTTTLTETKILNTTSRTETITVSSIVENITTISNNSPGILVSSENIPPQSLAYTNNDPNLGNRTLGYNSDPVFYQTEEFKLNIANSQINADKAYARGWTGKGVTVAVADTGYSLSNTDLQGQIIATRDYTNTNMDDTNGHGTHVLGTIVAKKNNEGIHGVAFDAKAIPIKIGTGPSVDINAAASGFSWAADQGATIGNLSANSNYDPTFKKNIILNSDGTYRSTDSRYNYSTGQFYNMQTPTPWKEATDKGMIIVNSAGNQGLAVPANPGYFATVTDANGNLLLGGKMLIVGAANQDGSITWYSNKSGHICQNYSVSTNTCSDRYKVSDFYIMASGGTISTNINNGTSYMEGTSMAAPVVAGGLALLQQMWPYMKAENTVQLVLKTANKNIPNYDVNINGQGLLDLDKATQPYGAVGIPTTGRTTSSVSTIPISSSGGSGSALSAIAKTGVISRVMIVDEFARDFYVNLTKGVTFKDKRKVSEVKTQQFGNNYLPFQQNLGNFETGGEFDVYNNIKLGILTNSSAKGDWSSYLTKSLDLSKEFKIRTNIGTLNELNTWLGNEGSGALSIGKNNLTYYSQLGLDYINKQDKWSIDFGRGFTKVNSEPNSLIKNFANIQTQTYKLGYENSLDETRSWGLTLSLPNYITKGSANLSVPYATTLDGEIIYTDIKAALKTSTPEKNIGLYYTDKAINELDWNFRINTEYRNNIAGQEGKNGFGFGLYVDKKF
jgi:subtilisin family serine protease